MSNGFSSLIQADLASLTSAAQNMANSSANHRCRQPVRGARPQAASPSPVHAKRHRQGQHAGRGSRPENGRCRPGKSDDLVGAMLSSQEASLSFSMLMQVRNKVMGGLDELIKLPL
jgi:flagellar hook-basal body complex protein FliE